MFYLNFITKPSQVYIPPNEIFKTKLLFKVTKLSSVSKDRSNEVEFIINHLKYDLKLLLREVPTGLL